MPFLADHRDTSFCLMKFHQGPNGIGVEMAERGVYKSAPPTLTLTDGSDPKDTKPDLSPEVVAAGIVFLAGVEAAYAKRYAELVTATSATDPSRVHALVTSAMKAQGDLATAKADRDAAEAQKSAAQAEHARLRLESEQKKAEHARLDEELAAKRAALAALAPTESHG